MGTRPMNLPEGYTLDSQSSGVNLPAGYTLDQPEQTTALGAAGRGALDAVPFGDKLYAAGAANIKDTTYDKELGNLDHQIALDKSQHPIAHDVGEVGGTVAPFLIPGVGEALGAESIAGRAAVGAGMGALQGASENRDSSKLGSDVAKGAGIGAIANPIVGGLGDLAGKAFNAITPSAKEFQSEATAGVLGATGRQIRSMPGINPEESVNKIGDWFSTAKSQDGTPLFSYGDHLGDRLAKVEQYHNEAGQTIGNTLKSAGVDSVPANPIIEKLQASSKFATPDEKAQTQSVVDTLTQASDPKTGAIPFSTLHSLKGEIGKAAYPKSGRTVGPLADAYHAISDMQENALQTYGKAIDLPGFQSAKDNYAMSSRAIPMLKMGLGKEIVNGTKMGSMLPAIGIGALGNPAAGAATAAGTVLRPSVERLGKSAMFGLAQGLKNAPSLAGTGDRIALSVTNGLLNHPDMAPYVAAFKGATQGITDPAQIEKANAVTDTILSQNNPHYAATKSKLQSQ